MDESIARGIADRRIKPIINNHLLNTFFPPFIKDRKNKFNEENFLFVLLPVFWKYKSFWKNIAFHKFRRKPGGGVISFLQRRFALLFYNVIESGHYKMISAYKSDLKFQQFKQTFRSFGQNSSLPEPSIIKNPKYISIGQNFLSLPNLRIEAWDEYAGQKFSPEITIGDNVCFNTDIHIGCINKVTIGNNVMLASRIYISDHSHGEISIEGLALPPSLRPLVSRGPVTIEDNVWLGEGVCIFPGVTIERMPSSGQTQWLHPISLPMQWQRSAR